MRLGLPIRRADFHGDLKGRGDKVEPRPRKPTDNSVELVLNQHEALVLYEFLTRGQEKADDYSTIEDQAELRVLWDVQAMLESVLVEPLSPDYVALLAEARSKVRDAVDSDGD
jgi:hypothetical protein